MKYTTPALAKITLAGALEDQDCKWDGSILYCN
jgi:hypothetical protein